MNVQLHCCFDTLDVVEVVEGSYCINIWDLEDCPKEIEQLIPEEEKGEDYERDNCKVVMVANGKIDYEEAVLQLIADKGEEGGEV